MKMVWMALMAVSLAALLVVFLRRRMSLRWLGYGLLNIAVSAVLLYLLGHTNIPGSDVPVNWTTIGTLCVLGVPGLGMLVAAKAFLL